MGTKMKSLKFPGLDPYDVVDEQARKWISNEGVNILSYGAVGDGQTDNLNAFLSAIATGKPIYIPAGTYCIGGQLDITSDLCMYGEGVNSIIKLLPKDQSRPELYDERTVYNCYMLATYTDTPVNIELYDLVLDGSKDDYDTDALSNGSSRHDHVVCCDFQKPNSVKMQNVTIKNALIEGAYIWSGANTDFVMIDNCRFLSNGYYREDASGLHLEGDNKNTVVSNCLFADNGFHGLLTSGDNGKYQNIITRENGYDGVCLWGGASNNLLTNITSIGNRGGVHIKHNYSSYQVDDGTDGYANANLLQNIHTKNNTYGIMFGSQKNTRISGFISENDDYCYALCDTHNCDGSIILEVFSPAKAFGIDLASGGVNNYKIDLNNNLSELYPIREIVTIPLTFEIGRLSTSDGGTRDDDSTAVRNTDYVAVPLNTAVTISYQNAPDDTNPNIRVLAYDADKSFISDWNGGSAYASVANGRSITFTDSSIAYIKICMWFSSELTDVSSMTGELSY